MGLVTVNGLVDAVPGGNPALDIKGGRLVAFGTSRSAGGLPKDANIITGPRQLSSRHPSMLAGMLGLQEIMHATSGAVLSHDETTATGGGGGWCELFHKTIRLKPNQHQQGGGPTGGPMNLDHPDAIVTICDWINDQALVNGNPADSNPATRYNGNRQDTRTQIIIKETQRTLISLSQASRIWEPNHTGASELVYGGSASTYTAASYNTTRERPHRGAVSGPAGYRSMANGSWVEIPLPADYPGSAVAPVTVVFSAVYNTTAGNIVSSGTGVPTKTVDISRTSADNWATNPITMRFKGADLAPGAKTIRVTVSGLTGSNTRFQRAWIESDNPPYVLCYRTVYMNPIGGFLFPQNTTSDFDLYNASLKSVIAEHRPNVKYVDIPTLISPAPTTVVSALNIYYTDTMHWTELGNAEYASYGFSAVTGTPVSSALRQRALHSRATVQDFRCELSISANQAITTSTTTNILWDVELVDTSGMHDDLLNLDRIWAPTDGYYNINFSGGMQDGDAATGVRMMWVVLTRTDATTDQCPAVLLPTTGTSSFFPPSGQVTWSVAMRAGDYLTCKVVQTSGNTKSFLATGPIPRVIVYKNAEI